MDNEQAEMYSRFYRAAVNGGCDHAQARGIAKERTLLHIMGASAQIANAREAQMKIANSGRA